MNRMLNISRGMLVAAALATTLPLAAFEAAAQTRQVRFGGAPANVSVVHRTSQTLRTEQSFTDIVVGDPEIADAVPLTDRSIYVLGKKVGVTSVSVYDADKKLVGVIEVDVTQNAPRAAQDIRRSGEAGVRVAPEAGKLVLNGRVGDAVAADRAQRIARSHGGEVINQMRVTSPQQVMLEVRFIEVSRQAGRDFGVRLRSAGDDGRLISGRQRLGVDANGVSVAGLAATALTTGANAPFGTIIGQFVRGGMNIDVLIDALEEQGVARRLAEPNLVTLSGEKASFLAGGEIPIPVAQSQGAVSVEFKKFGVGLTFTPTVLAGSMINLKIEPEVSQVDTATDAIKVGQITIPRLIVSRASTVVELKSGQSFAVAGLLQSVNQATTEQVPWLGEVPVIGSLFRSKSFQKKETELAIIVTPHLVQPVRPGQRLRTPLDTTAPANDVDRFLIGRQEVPRDGYPRTAPFEPLAAAHRQAGQGHILDISGVNNASR
jgi:pilus assembly protein CpaC